MRGQGEPCINMHNYNIVILNLNLKDNTANFKVKYITCFDETISRANVLAAYQNYG